MLERLQKIIARAGIASRRHAEELIRSGQVRVNGNVVTELGAKADPEHDRVEAAGQVAQPQAKPVYYLLYKPAHVVSTMSDPEGRATLRHVLRGLAGGVFPVGRLDYAASGLILLTSDGVLADRIFKVSARIPQVYWIKVKGALGHDLIRQIGHSSHARLRPLRGPAAAKRYADNPWYEVELGEARRDLLRRDLFAAGHPVEKMKRVQLGPLELGDFPEGHYRQLAPSEIARLREAIERAEKAPRLARESGSGARHGWKKFRPFQGKSKMEARAPETRGSFPHSGPNVGAKAGPRTWPKTAPKTAPRSGPRTVRRTDRRTGTPAYGEKRAGQDRGDARDRNRGANRDRNKSNRFGGRHNRGSGPKER